MASGYVRKSKKGEEKMKNKRNKMIAYRRKCKNCGQEIIVTNVKTELCWRCREKIRKGIRRNSRENGVSRENGEEK